MDFKEPSAAVRYYTAVLAAMLAQIARLPMDPPTLLPTITYVPFIAASAWFGGLRAGVLTAVLCAIESMYFAIEPIHAFAVRNPWHWEGIGILVSVGLATGLLFDRMKQLRRTEVLRASAQARWLQEFENRQRMLENIVQNSPAAIALLRGHDFVIEMMNPAYQKLAPGEPMTGKTVADIWPDAAPLVLPLLRRVRETGTVYHATGMPFPRRRRHDAAVEERHFDFSYVPLKGFGGEDDLRVLVVAIEVTAYKRSEAELRAAHQELAAIHANAPVSLLVLDEKLRVRKVNELAASLAGRPLVELLEQPHGEAIGCLNALDNPQGCGHGPACSRCAVRLAVLESLKDSKAHREAEAWLPFEVGGQRQQRCLMVHTAPIEYDGERKVLVCSQDITGLKHTEEALRRTVRQLESALAEKTVLLQEVHHRVKNNLAVISSLLGMKADATEIAEVKQALEESQRRVRSIALIHEYLYGTEHLERIDFSKYAGQIVNELHTEFVDQPARISVNMAVEPIELGIHRAVPCALILNELVSNAFKHAFTGRPSGTLRVSFHESAPDRLQLIVEDDGAGTPLGILERDSKSLGLRIVRILATQLEGTLKQESSAGTRFVLEFPAGPDGR